MKDLGKKSNKNPFNPASGMMYNGDPTFWTPEILKKLMFFNYQRKNNGGLQDVYEQARNETREAYEKRKEVLMQLKKAMKQGNQLEVARLQEQADRYSKQYERSYHYGQMKIFSIKNDKVELRDQYIDLHGLSKVEAINIVKLRL